MGGVKCGPLSKALPLETNTKNVLKWIHALLLLFNIQSSNYGITNVAKVSLYSTFTKSTVSFGYERDLAYLISNPLNTYVMFNLSINCYHILVGFCVILFRLSVT